MDIYPTGIDIVENKTNFKREFGFEINVGVIKLGWRYADKE